MISGNGRGNSSSLERPSGGHRRRHEKHSDTLYSSSNSDNRHFNGKGLGMPYIPPEMWEMCRPEDIERWYRKKYRDQLHLQKLKRRFPGRDGTASSSYDDEMASGSSQKSAPSSSMLSQISDRSQGDNRKRKAHDNSKNQNRLIEDSSFDEIV